MLNQGGRRHFGEEVSLQVGDGVALLTLLGVRGEFPWGTKREEHRLNPPLVAALNAALDAAEARDDVQVVVVANEGKFWSNGVDLKYMDSHDAEACREHAFNIDALLARVCCFPLPTVAAFTGHWCAAGGMLGLTFDFRVMCNDSGFFFIPGIDLGIVYSPAQIEIMKAKLPTSMHREVILFNSKRWVAQELATVSVVDVAVPSADVVPRALELAASLRPKGQGAARKALGPIKKRVYRSVLEALAGGVEMSIFAKSKGVDRAAPPAPGAAVLSKL